MLIGDDAAQVAALWEAIQSAGGVELPRLDEHTYREVILEIFRTPATGSSSWSGLGEDPGDITGLIQAPIRYRYDFIADGMLAEARAWGPDVDLLLRAGGEDKVRCETVDTIGFPETLQEICEEQAAAHPNLALQCQSYPRYWLRQKRDPAACRVFFVRESQTEAATGSWRRRQLEQIESSPGVHIKCP